MYPVLKWINHEWKSVNQLEYIISTGSRATQNGVIRGEDVVAVEIFVRLSLLKVLTGDVFIRPGGSEIN